MPEDGCLVQPQPVAFSMTIVKCRVWTVCLSCYTLHYHNGDDKQ